MLETIKNLFTVYGLDAIVVPLGILLLVGIVFSSDRSRWGVALAVMGMVTSIMTIGVILLTNAGLNSNNVGLGIFPPIITVITIVFGIYAVNTQTPTNENID